MTDGDDSSEDEESGLGSGWEERQEMTPEEGYALVKIDKMKPPGEALMKLGEYKSLNEISMRPATEWADYVVYDSDGRAYTHDDLPDPVPIDRANELREEVSTAPKRVDVEAIGDLVQTDGPTVQQTALRALNDVVETRPEDVLDLLPVLTPRLESDDHTVRCETLYCLAELANQYPRQLTPVADDVIDFLDAEADEEVLMGTIPYIVAVAEVEPRAVVDTVPKLAALLQADIEFKGKVVDALLMIAKVYPESVLPVASELVSYIEPENSVNQVAALAAVGHIAKEYPNAAESALPTVIELLDAEAYRVRANAAGLLAELADQYPESVRSAVPRVIDLLDDEDEKVRYNATSILAHVAKAYPDDVEAATEPLIDALDEEFSYSRLNACWALGYLEAMQARDALESVRHSDQNEEVRDAAEQALQRIDQDE